jgi:flagellar basal-body rod modification protein FlgD|uniref:Basal-body rod modification protein FlgD n=1 Tax=Desulfobacca acetoxidans TaxID=60893 RepID=A0A7C3WR68_9BACT
MTVTDYAASSAISAKSTDSSKSRSVSESVAKTVGKEDFLKLLVTQLRFQDPLSPADPKEFVAQLAQFSSLEQQINANQNLESLGSLIQTVRDSLSLSQGVNLLGKSVKGVGNSLRLEGGRVDAATYQLARGAEEVKVAILDGAGQVVRTLNLGPQSGGLRQFAWDGKDGNGKALPDGSYTYRVTALDSQGQGVEVTNYFTGTVQEVFQDQKGVWLRIDGREVPLDRIVSVSQAS